MADTPSLLDSLRETRDELTKAREPQLFELPGYGTKLQAKYRILTPSEETDLEKMRFRLVQANDDGAVDAFRCATLARACVGLFTEVDGEVVPLNEAEDLGDDPIHWGDARLAEAFQLPVGKAREMIEQILGAGPEGEKRIRAHFFEVAGWMDRGQQAIDADF